MLQFEVVWKTVLLGFISRFQLVTEPSLPEFNRVWAKISEMWFEF